MKKLRLFLHTTLDGFVAGEKGEMDWINLSEELFDITSQYTDTSDRYLLGRKTFEMMEGYWPNAGQKPDASKHDKEHSDWYNNVSKVVISKTLAGRSIPNSSVISRDLGGEIKKLKQSGGKDIITFGSPSAAHSLMELDLIDEYGLFVNPVLLGKGIPAFSDISKKLSLKLVENKQLSSAVVFLLYRRNLTDY